MKLSGLILVPENIVDGLKYTYNWQKEYAKSERFSEIIGKDEMTKQQLIQTLRKENIVSDGILGTIKAEIILRSTFPTGSADQYYEFLKMKTSGSDAVRYKLYKHTGYS